MSPTVYLDNAATSFPKPPCVLDALSDFTQRMGASAGRGAYAEALETGALLGTARERLAALFHITDDPRQIVFTLNATDALNLALKGWLRPGDHVITSCLEHNSVLRPLHALEQARGIQVTRVPCTADGIVRPLDIARAIRPATRLITVIHASNVLGTVTPIGEIGRLARTRGIAFLVDAAQTAGTYPIDVEQDQIDFLAFPGHKGLLGPLGTGGLYLRAGYDLAPLREGGTGSVSEQDVQPEFLPDRYEAGSHNALGVAGLAAALGFLAEEGVATVRRQKMTLTACFLDGVRRLPGVTAYGPARVEDRVAVVSLTLDGLPPHEAAQVLDTHYGIKVRAGLHCAPLVHQAMGTFPAGTIRFSFSVLTSIQQVEYAVHALDDLTARRVARAPMRPSIEPVGVPVGGLTP